MASEVAPQQDEDGKKVSSLSREYYVRESIVTNVSLEIARDMGVASIQP